MGLNAPLPVKIVLPALSEGPKFIDVSSSFFTRSLGTLFYTCGTSCPSFAKSPEKSGGHAGDAWMWPSEVWDNFCNVVTWTEIDPGFGLHLSVMITWSQFVSLAKFPELSYVLQHQSTIEHTIYTTDHYELVFHSFSGTRRILSPLLPTHPFL